VNGYTDKEFWDRFDVLCSESTKDLHAKGLTQSAIALSAIRHALLAVRLERADATIARLKEEV
jgi:hypothetical protein